MQLTQEQLNQFHTEGFIVLRNFVDSKRCDTLLTVGKEHLEKKIEPIETEVGYGTRSKAYRTLVSDYASHEEQTHMVVRRLRQVYDRDIVFQSWMKDGDIRPILEQILNDQVVLITAHHNSIMTKIPQWSTDTRWHQDRRYWQYDGDNLVSIWLALDDENSDNGALEFIPGSHKVKFDATQFDKKEYFSESSKRNQAMIEKKVSTVLNKGDIIIFHSLLLHRANKNNTTKTKFSFVYTVKGLQTAVIKGSRSAMFPEIPLEK